MEFRKTAFSKRAHQSQKKITKIVKFMDEKQKSNFKDLTD